MMFEYVEEIERLANIKVAGVGGAGGNAVNRMIEAGLAGVEFLAVNTDLQVLKDSQAHQTLQIGAQLTKGLGSGGDPSRGLAAAEESRDTLATAVDGADMVFITAGMGGGTGTGAAPLVAEIARKQGALTVGIVTRPFAFEGTVRLRQADEGIDRLRDAVDTLIVIPNQRLLEVVPPSTSMQEAFRIADNILYEATRGIYEIISRHDHVNLDFADVRSVMKGMGEAMMGTGRAEGEDRALEAAKAAIRSPLLEDVDILGSKAVLVNVLGREVGLQDTAAALQYIQDAAGSQAHVIFGYGTDDSMGDTLQVTVIATGFRHAGDGVGRFAPAVIDATSEEKSAPIAEEQVDPAPVAEEQAEENELNANPAPAASLLEKEDTDPLLPGPDADEAADQEGLPTTPETVFVAEAPTTAPLEPEPVVEAVEPQHSQMAWVARAGGGDADVVMPQEQSSTVEPFLQRVGTRNIGEVEVPDPGVSRLRPQGRPAAGLGAAGPGDDLNAPAYTRKYMD